MTLIETSGTSRICEHFVVFYIQEWVCNSYSFNIINSLTNVYVLYLDRQTMSLYKHLCFCLLKVAVHTSIFKRKLGIFSFQTLKTIYFLNNKNRWPERESRHAVVSTTQTDGHTFIPFSIISSLSCLVLRSLVFNFSLVVSSL